ncbi:NlpC/P60 family protein [Elizabethkingia argentiflava]|uniref:NlpC/P60 family protein n=1 Tax=Elizabethkingia argenteiflava TaxID=2681556 RepID=A0A845PPK6_9FLAO|nr:C40 family peptidase [Elizabethkingia argenteiflava]NAW50259.1 NlpC/P60 family protein [Elizabethkingia argenteiflava]
MSKKIVILCAFCLLVLSCSSSRVLNKRHSSGQGHHMEYAWRNLNSNFKGSHSRRVKKLLRTAENYMGTPYRYGGISRSGMDCSGFVKTVFDQHHINLPRRSEDQSLAGKSINIKKVMPGDLLFFATSKGPRVSHVGIVYSILDGEVSFIHASTSRGVTISSLRQQYWNKAYVSARRLF